MAGYCGKCKKYYKESWQDHDLECDGGYDPANVQGTPENFEKERRSNGWDDDQAQEIWNKYYRHQQ